jgi:hypothetical protein
MRGFEMLPLPGLSETSRKSIKLREYRGALTPSEFKSIVRMLAGTYLCP